MSIMEIIELAVGIIVVSVIGHAVGIGVLHLIKGKK